MVTARDGSPSFPDGTVLAKTFYFDADLKGSAFLLIGKMRVVIVQFF